MTEIYSDDDLLRIRESNKFLEMKIPSKVVAISAAIETMKSKELTNEKLIRDLREKVSTLEKQCDESHKNAVILDLKQMSVEDNQELRKKVSALEKRCIGTNGERDYAGFTALDITPHRIRSGSYHEPVDSRKFPPSSDKPLPIPNGKSIRDLYENQCIDNVVTRDFKRGKTMADETFLSLENSEKDYAGFAGNTKLDRIINHKSKCTTLRRSGSYHEPDDCICGPGNACIPPPASDKPLHTSAPFNRPPRYGQSIYSSAPRTVPPPLVPINNNFSSISNMFGCNCSRLKKCTCVDIKGYSSVTGDEAC